MQYGPASTRDKSTTRSPFNGAVTDVIYSETAAVGAGSGALALPLVARTEGE